MIQFVDFQFKYADKTNITKYIYYVQHARKQQHNVCIIKVK